MRVLSLEHGRPHLSQFQKIKVFSPLSAKEGCAGHEPGIMHSCTWQNGWMNGFLKSTWSRSSIQRQVWKKNKPTLAFSSSCNRLLKHYTIFASNIFLQEAMKTFNITYVKIDDLARMKGHAQNKGHIKYRTPTLKLQEFNTRGSHSRTRLTERTRSREH